MIKVITNNSNVRISTANAIIDRLYAEGYTMGFRTQWSSMPDDNSLIDTRPCRIMKQGKRRLITGCAPEEDQKIMVIPVNGKTTIEYSDKTYLFNPDSASKVDVFRDNLGVARLLVFRLHKGAESVKLGNITGDVQEYHW